MGQLIFILGGARSGKSIFAERLAQRLGGPVLYVATSEVENDPEWEARIAAHQRRRPVTWRTLEASHQVALRIRESLGDARVVVLDCVTLLAGNILQDGVHDAEQRLLGEMNDLIALARTLPITLLVVSNEVGMGVVPPYPLGRLYRDLLGQVHQYLAKQADAVYFLLAGIPVRLNKAEEGLLPAEGGITIRVATPEDMQAVGRVLALSFHDKFAPLVGNQAPAIIPQLPIGHVTLIAERNGSIVGALVMDMQHRSLREMRRAWPAIRQRMTLDRALRAVFGLSLFPRSTADAHRAYIHMVGVLPEERGRGIGQLLLRAALSEARRQGKSYVDLHVMEYNLRAQRLYARLGFSVVGTDTLTLRRLFYPFCTFFLMRVALDNGDFR